MNHTFLALTKASQGNGSGTPTGITDNFSGTFPTRSDGGSWATANGTAPTNSAGKLGPTGGVGGDIVADLTYQNGTYQFDVNSTVGTFTPLLRVLWDGSATTNYIGLAIDTAANASAFGLIFYNHLGGSFTNTGCPISNTPVLTSGVTGTITLIITGAPAAPSFDLKFNGTRVPMSPAVPTVSPPSQWITAATNSGATRTGLMVPSSGVTFDNFTAV